MDDVTDHGISVGLGREERQDKSEGRKTWVVLMNLKNRCCENRKVGGWRKRRLRPERVDRIATFRRVYFWVMA